MNIKAQKHHINDLDNHLYQLYNISKNIPEDEIISHIESAVLEYALPKERTRRVDYQDMARIEEYKNSYYNLKKRFNFEKNPLDMLTLMYCSFSQQMRFDKKGDYNTTATYNENNGWTM